MFNFSEVAKLFVPRITFIRILSKRYDILCEQIRTVGVVNKKKPSVAKEMLFLSIPLKMS